MKARFSILQIKEYLGSIRQLYKESDDWHFTADFMTLKRIYRRGDYEALNQISPKARTTRGKTWDLMAEKSRI
jgi:hypothetical protein